MCKAPYIAALLCFTLCILSPDRITAQQSNLNSVVYEAARNKIGLMRYCRNNTTLDPAIAEKAVEVIETGLRTFRFDELTRELGDRAEQAGEEGFLDVVRRRDIADFAQRFGTTTTGLCQQWAEEALPVRKLRQSRPALSIATIQPIPSRPTTAPLSVNVAHSITIPHAAELPPPPIKAPFRPAEAGLAFQQGTTSVTTPHHLRGNQFCPPPE